MQKQGIPTKEETSKSTKKKVKKCILGWSCVC
ncbi:hypothetical protein V6Z12_A11G260900 [Gossypium hirsutum]